MGVYIKCDGCGKEYMGNANALYGHSSIGNGGRMAIRAEAVTDGWSCDPSSNHDYCPDYKPLASYYPMGSQNA